MSKTRIFALLMLALILGAILTNPTKDYIEGVVKGKAKDLLEKQLNYKDREAVQLGMTLFGDRIIQEFMDKNITVENYYVLSLVKLNWQGQQIPIGTGAFKQVWLSSKIDEKADEIIEVLKKL